MSQSTPPLAVIGIGCLFPGANDFPTFWSRIVGRADAIREVPPTHWRIEDYLDPDPKAPDRIYAARGGFLDPVSFNPQAFGIPPSNLEATDASQLLGLLVAQQALDDCGYVLSGEAAGKKLVDRNRVSVILGVTGTLQLVIPLGARLGHPLWRRALREAGVDEAVADDVVQRIADGYVPWQENSFPGLLGNVVAGRIANRFDMGGTNCVVDAACASSLSAIHLAAMELTTGRADLVLTGGVDTFNDIFMFTCFSKTPALSPTGNARPFDAAGDGTVLGEGLGMVVLKRLDDARRDGDRIYAVLRGVGSSSDGKGNAIYAPRKEGQVDALTSAYRISGVTPDTIELVEAHGTGTRVGDATEVSALAEVFGRSGRAAPWCAVGSIKSQIGHTKAAAGVAGLIKAVASLYHKVLPPTIKVSKPLDVFQEPGCPLYVNTEQRPWLPSPHHPRRAAVSAFGFGGSNFHAVLEEADPRKPAISWTGQVQIVPFAAESKPALIQRMKEFSTQQTWEALHRQADDLRRAFTPTAPWRLVLVVEREKFDLARLTTRALALLEREDPRSLPAEGLFVGHGPAGRMGVLFPGQGAQYVGMFRDLVCHFPAAFDVLTQADASFAETSSRRLVDLLYPPPAFSPEAEAAQEASLRATDVAQPALGAVSLAGWRVLQKFGLRATAFAGHSYGELTALAAAGWLGDTDFFSLSALRGRLMAEAGQARDAGAMLAAKAGLEELRAILAEEQIDLVLANKNAPRQTVLSGTNENIERAAAVLARRSIGTVRLTVAAAFHSPLVAAARAPFAQALTEVTLTPGATVYANTTAQVYPSRTDEARDLLAGQLAQPVEWVRLIEAMASDGITEFLEVGPGGRLAGLVDAILAGRSVQIATWDATQGQRSGWTDLAMVLAWLAARGQTVDLASWDPLPPRTEAPGRPGLQVELSGVNYVKPRTPRPPRAPLTPPTSPRSEAPMQAPLLQNGSSRGEHSVQMPPPPSPPSPAPAPAPLAQASSPVDATALGRALEITRESLATLQQMQEQTAQVHRQYLDGQENAQRTVHLLVEQQHRLLQASLGMPVAPLPALQSAPARAMAPAPVVTPRPTPQARPAPVPVPPPPSARPASPPPAPRVEQRPTHAPVAPPPPAPAPSTQANGRVEKVLLEVIAEKTGYPAEMLELGMSLDADLGIDSIKRVEILSALQERLPDAPTVKPEHLGTLHTLGDITAFLAGSTGVVASTTAPAPSRGGSARVEKVLLEVIAEKTGYPAEMLELGMSLDADLGIDSIKRVEILSALQERLPDAPTVKPEHLGTLHTLGDITAFLAGSTGAPAPIRAPEPPAPGPTPSPRTVPSPAVQPSGVLERSVVRAVPLTGSRAEDGWMPGGEIWIADDSTPMAEAIADLLRERGLAPRLVSLEAPPEGTPHGLILVAPSGPLAEEWLWQALRAVQVTASALRQARGRLLTVASLDGAFGLNGGSPGRVPLDGGLAGLAKTVAQEWPEVRARALDLAPTIEVGRAASWIVAELFKAGPVEVGLTPQGERTLVRETGACPAGQAVPFEPGDVVVISGGARGVTAEVAVELAAAFQPTLVLLGRSPEPGPTPDDFPPGDENTLRRELSQREPRLSPREVNERVRALLAEREIRTTLRRITESGGRAIYRSVDVRDAAALARVLTEVRSLHGPVRGLVHGAGVLADARIEQKTAAQFHEVFSTKVAGLHALLAAIGEDALRAVVLFSSSTARFGRTGQVDYAIANEVLNKLAWHESARRPGCRVVSLNWGPWDGGMVTPGLKKLFASEGVDVIPLTAGARLLVDELRSGPEGPTEVVVLALPQGTPTPPMPTHGVALPPPLPTAFERVLDLADFPVLASHVLDGRPVLPTVLMLEWLAHAAMVQNPGLAFHGLDDLRVLHGVQLEGAPPTLRVGAGKAVRRDGFFVAPAELRSTRPEGKEILHARAEVVLAANLPPTPEAARPPELSAFTMPVAELYRRGLLFHGPALQGIDRVEGCGESGIMGVVRSAPPPPEWMRQPLRQHWLSDPLVLDTAFQLVIVWTQERRGAASLPVFLSRYRQYRRGFPAQGARVVVTVNRASELHALTTIDIVDLDGRLIARLEGYESVIDAHLAEAFRHNAPASAR